MIVVCRVAGDPGPKGPADCVLMGVREPVVLGLGDRLPECLVQAVEDVAHGENRRRSRRSLRVSGCALDHERKAREHERDVREHHARAVRHGAVRAVVHGNGAHGTAREILDAQVPGGGGGRPPDPDVVGVRGEVPLQHGGVRGMGGGGEDGVDGGFNAHPAVNADGEVGVEPGAGAGGGQGDGAEPGGGGRLLRGGALAAEAAYVCRPRGGTAPRPAEVWWGARGRPGCAAWGDGAAGGRGPGQHGPRRRS